MLKEEGLDFRACRQSWRVKFVRFCVATVTWLRVSIKADELQEGMFFFFFFHELERCHFTSYGNHHLCK